MKKFFCVIIFCIGSVVFAAQETDFSMNGAVLVDKKENAEIWKKSDGTVITVYKDRSEAKLSDSTKIIKYPDGRREVFNPDGSSIIINEKKGIREYRKNGTQKTIDFTGMTPFGEKITRIEKVILKDPKITMIYVPERSDEILYPDKTEEKVEWEIKDFFDHLYDSVRQKYINDAQKKNKLLWKTICDNSILL